MSSANNWKQKIQNLLRESGGDAATLGSQLESLRGEMILCDSPLLRAEGLLALYSTPASMRNYDQTLADLRLARVTFAANQRSHEENQSLVLTAACLRLRGHMQACLAVTDRALQSHALSGSHRMQLGLYGLQALASLLRFDEAEDWANRYVLPRLLSSAATTEFLDMWLAMGYFRLQQFSRARNAPSAITLDIPPDRAPDAEAAKLHMQAACNCLKGASACARGELSQQRVQVLEMAVMGCQGRLDDARSIYQELTLAWRNQPPHFTCGVAVNFANVLRTCGQTSEAYQVMQDAVRLGEQHGLGFVHSSAYSMARLAQELGQHEAALAHYERFLLLHNDRYRTTHQWFTEQEDLQAFGAQPRAVAMHPSHLLEAKPPYLRHAERIVAERLSAPPSIEELAALVNVSRRSLETAMRRCAGMSPLTWVRAQRMARAAHLLSHTQTPLKSVAASLGYAHPGTFTRDFKKVYGQLPSVHRDKAI